MQPHFGISADLYFAVENYHFSPAFSKRMLVAAKVR
jgi:hypothetical protein